MHQDEEIPHYLGLQLKFESSFLIKKKFFFQDKGESAGIRIRER